MNVGDRMTRELFTIDRGVSVSEARDLMKAQKIHRLPVVAGSEKRLVGIVTEKDILYASPSPATTLDVWEMSSLLSKLTVDELMTKDLITSSSDTPIEEAARLLADHDIGGLPVVDEGRLVGIITESDIFKVFVDLFGSRDKGIRLTISIPNVHGELANLAGALRDAGGDILAFGSVRKNTPAEHMAIIKVSGLDAETLTKTVKPFVREILELRES